MEPTTRVPVKLGNEHSIKPYITKYAIIGIAIYLILLAIQFTFHKLTGSQSSLLKSIGSVGLVLILDIIYILIMVLAVKAFKKDNNGFISLGKAFVLSFITGLIIALVTKMISLGWSYINDFSYNLIISNIMYDLVVNSVLGAIVAFIVSLVLRKEKS